MSVFNFDLNCIFIHIPRCAGNSMESLVGSTGHERADYYRDFFQFAAVGKTMDDIFKFSFVRNPWDKFVSGYFHLGNKEENFTKFVEDMAYGIIPNGIHFKPQYQFICNYEKDLLVDFVGRYENIQDDWKKVCDVLKVKHKLPWQNKAVNRRRDWESYYTSKTKKIIYDVYKDDFEMFYKKEGDSV